MNGTYKLLILADDSPEFAAAAVYAGLHAKAMGAGLVMLCVIEPAEFAHWSSVEQEMRREAREAAQRRAERFAAEIWAECGIEPEIVLREGETRSALKHLIDEEREVRALVLGAGSGREGPGPLVASIAKGHGLASRPLPVIVVPGALAKEDLRALAAQAPARPAEGENPSSPKC